MLRIFHLASKDWRQFLRDRKTFLFLLIMPIAFTLLFGFAFGGTGGGDTDTRLPVAFLNQDDGQLGRELESMLTTSEVIRLESEAKLTAADYEKQVGEQKLAALVIVPAGYSATARSGEPLKLTVVVDTGTQAGSTAQSAILAAANRVLQAARIARIVTQNTSGSTADFDATFAKALAAWQNPPVTLTVTKTGAVEVKKAEPLMSFTHNSPGMMLQFAIAGLLTSAQVLVTERKSRTLQRLLTTSLSRAEILLGHYLAIFGLVFTQFVLLILFGQIFLKVDYLRQPLATLLVAGAAALCIAALGLLIGATAKNDDQAVIFSLIPMFVFAGLGGAWMPLEFTAPAFQAVGHLSPVAWAMDGFKNIVARGLDLNSVLLPAAALVGYAVVFFGLATWRLSAE